MKVIKTLACLTISTISVTAFSQTSAMDWATNGTNTTSVTSTRGYSFNVTEAQGINVTHLTFFDNLADGLAESHDVGLWNSAGVLLASTTVSAGVVNPLDATGKFRSQAITPLFLAPGNDYVVAAVFLVGSADLQAINMTGLVMGAGLTYGQTRFNNNGVNSLSFPTNTISQVGLPGGSFIYTPVPEPATLVAIGLGGLMLLLRRRTN